jgi:phosphatidylserine synthase
MNVFKCRKKCTKIFETYYCVVMVITVIIAIIMISIIQLSSFKDLATKYTSHMLSPFKTFSQYEVCWITDLCISEFKCLFVCLFFTDTIALSFRNSPKPHLDLHY